MEALSTATWCGATLVAFILVDKSDRKKGGPANVPAPKLLLRRTWDAKLKCAASVSRMVF